MTMYVWEGGLLETTREQDCFKFTGSLYSYTVIRTLPLTGGLLHLVQRGGACAGCGPAQSHHRCTKCNSSPINGQCTNHCIAI